MGYYTYADAPIGNFVEKEHGNNFEYSLNNEKDDYSKSIVENYPHKVWVGGGQINDSGPVLERWFIKGHREYN